MLYRTQIVKHSYYDYLVKSLCTCQSRVAGLEPAIMGTKNPCLTIWRYPYGWFHVNQKRHIPQSWPTLLKLVSLTVLGAWIICSSPRFAMMGVEPTSPASLVLPIKLHSNLVYEVLH